MQWMSFFPTETLCLQFWNIFMGKNRRYIMGDLKPDNLMLSDSGKFVSGGFWERGVWIWRKSADLYGNRRLLPLQNNMREK